MEARPLIAQTVKGPIEYRLEGQGAPILVLQGGHCSRRTRLSHERLVGCGFQVLTPSRPGYDSTPVSVGRTAQAAADSLAILLDHLALHQVDVIGISAAGPTALAFAQRHPARIRRLVLESAVTLPWSRSLRLGSRLLFGPTERLTWAAMRAWVRLRPKAAVRAFFSGLTTHDVRSVVEGLCPEDFAYVVRMIEASQSGQGFLNDLQHRVRDLDTVTCPTLALYSPYDHAVRPENSQRLVPVLPHCEVVATSASSHLIWIGASAQEVWERRLHFLIE